jgi:excisionase family DNA binding protein
MTEQYLTTKAIAEKLGVTPKTIRLEIERGSLEAIKIGAATGRATYRVPASALERYLEQSATK